MSETVPEGWATARLSDVLEPGGIFDGPFGSHLKTSDYTKTGIRVIRLENVGNLRFVDDKRTYISRAKYASLTKHTVAEGDVIVGSFVDGAVRVCVLPSLGTKAIAKADCFCVRTRTAILDRRFLAFQLGASAARDALVEQIHGATRPRITTRQLRDFEIVVAPLVEQRRLVDAVEALFARIDMARARLAQAARILTRFRRSVLAAACSGRLTEVWRSGLTSSTPRASPTTTPAEYDTCFEGDGVIPPIPDIPETWSVTTVRHVASQIDYGSNAKADAEPRNGVPVLRMGNIQDGKLDYSDLKYVRRADDVRAYRLRPGDLLFNRTNSPELVGKAAVFDVTHEMVFASYLVRVRFAADRAIPEYVSAWINSPWGRAWARAVRTDGVSQSNINATKLADMPLPVPPIEEQREIVQRVRALMTLADAAEQRAAAGATRAAALKQSVLARAFRGDLVPTEADLARRDGGEYESADQLLEPIKRAARSTAHPQRRTRSRAGTA